MHQQKDLGPGGVASAMSDVVDEEGAPDAGVLRTPRRSWRQRLAVAGVVLLVLGALGLSTAFGWMLRGWVPGSDVGVTRVVVERPVRVEADAVKGGTLPNVLGLPVAAARQAYSDAGVDPTRITEHPIPYVGEPGSVVEQRPLAATRITDQLKTVDLRVAAPATMPDLVGVGGDDARARLNELGAGATTVVRYDPAVQPGEVAATRPPAGQPVPPRVDVIVSESPSSVDLEDLEPESSDCGTATSGIDCQLYSGDTAVATYTINAKVTSFEASASLDGPSSATAELEVRRDGRVLGSYGLTTRARDIEVDVPDGGKRLSLVIRRTGHGTSTLTAQVRDARIVGARSGIDALAP